jgi:predicted AlkP superfamily phosphohydrolase/phosphomutase
VAGLAKIVVIALDAADAGLIEEWRERGFLPALQNLAKTGRAVPTSNPPGLYTGALWPSFFTAASPGSHGRYFYRQLRPGSYDLVNFDSEGIPLRPFWEVLSDAGRRVGVIDVPKAPLATRLNGLQISDWGSHDTGDAPRSYPTELIGEVLRRFGSDPVGSCDLRHGDESSLGSLRDALVERLNRKAAISEHCLTQGGFDLFVTTFSEGHCAGHQFWHVHDKAHPRHDAALATELGDPLRDVYVALDAAVGRVIQAAGSEATVIVLASHGMGPHYDGTFLLDDILRRIEGLGPPRRKAVVEKLRLAWRATPSSLRQRLQSFGDRIYESAASQDRRRRKCFAVPTNDNCGGIRINLVGREPAGRVRRGAECDRLCDDLRAELLALVEARSGRPVVRDVLRTRDCFSGDRLEDLPDLLVRWHRDAPIGGVASPRIGRIEREYRGNRTGDHRSGGAVYMRGPMIDVSQMPPRVDLTDLAPTIAALLDVTLPEADGRPIQSLLAK